MEVVDLLIVGAGFHGLAMAKTYQETCTSGKFVVLDSAQSVGGTWAHERLYPGLKTNNVVGTYEFSDFPLVADQYGLKPKQHIPGQVVHEYFRDFCDAFGLTPTIRLQTKVESLELLPDSTWKVGVATTCHVDADSESNHGSVQALIASKLVLATGTTSEPAMPRLPGLEAFKGSIFHAKDFKLRSQDLDGANKVVVIGGNKSAWDVCYTTCTRYDAQAHMVMRKSGGGPSICWPATMEGCLKSISAASATRFFSWFDPNPYGYTACLIRTALKSTWFGRKLAACFWSCLDRKVSALKQYGQALGVPYLKPWTSTFWMGNSLGIHNFESNWFDLVRSGQIQTHVSEVSYLSAQGVHLQNGTVIEADTIVCCTGWKTGTNIRFTPTELAKEFNCNNHSEDMAYVARVRAEVLRTTPILRAPPIRTLPANVQKSEPSEEARDSVKNNTTVTNPLRLYRFMVPCSQRLMEMKNVAVIGSHLTLHTAIVAQAQALWISAFFMGRIPAVARSHFHDADFETIRRETFYHTEYQRIRRPKECGGSGERYPDLVFDSIPYVDLLLADLGLCCYRKRTWWKEIMEPYRLPDFKGLTDEWLVKEKTAKRV